MNVVFSSRFKRDLEQIGEEYADVSERLEGDFRERIAGIVREIIRWEGGDHVGPHGFPCRRSSPFPFYVYYQQDEHHLRFLALVHEKRHPRTLGKHP